MNVHKVVSVVPAWCICVFIIILYLISDESSVGTIVESRLSADDFKVEKIIGRGAFGEVQLVSGCVRVSGCAVDGLCVETGLCA